MIRRLQPSETLEEVRSEFEYSRQRLSGDARTPRLAQELEKFIQRLDALASGAVGTQLAPQQLELLVEEANRERCRLFGELTAVACASQLETNWPTRFFKQVQQPQRGAPLAERTSSGPNLPDEWVAVANQRAADARAILERRPSTPMGAIYMAGYAIECSLKALMRSRNLRFPTSGAAGHDLRELWEKSGFRLSDLNDSNGAKAFYIEQWTTSLRYEADMASHLSAEELLRGAGELAGWIQMRARRARGQR